MERREFIKGSTISSLGAFALSSLSMNNSELGSPDQRYKELLNMVHHNPGEPDFTTLFAEPFRLKELSYTGQIPKIYVQCGLTYDSLGEDKVPIGSDERLWIERHAALVNLQIINAQKSQIPVYPFTDFLVLPKHIIDLYGNEMMINGKLSIQKEKTQEIIRIQVAEIFDRFSGLAGITLRHGETYLQDTPFHKGDSPARTPAEHALLMNILREEICVKRNKRLIYRTWDFGFFHTNPEFYLGATNTVQPHPQLFISIKHVNYDFNRGFPFNKTIGLGNHQQLIEISTNQAGCYGKNSHPYYIGRGIIEGWREMEEKKGIRNLVNDPKIKGYWIWTWGDGWGGPYFSNEFWINLNEFVLREYIFHPTQSEEEIFFRYTKKYLHLDNENSLRLRKLCLLSEDAVYYGQASRFFSADPWWCRDHYFSAIDLKKVVSEKLVDKVLEEKRQNTEIWHTIENLAHQVESKDTVLMQFIRISSMYGRIKYELIELIWRIQIIQEQLNAGKQVLNSTVKEEINNYENKWQEWVALKMKYPECPTLYRDHITEHCGPPFRTTIEKLNKFVE